MAKYKSAGPPDPTRRKQRSPAKGEGTLRKPKKNTPAKSPLGESHAYWEPIKKSSRSKKK